ncbi:hypothetical protein GCM10009681_03400 [Luedemannella helvata]|uniref:TIR domain-containing protein n=1 Tax=Luedemannella helvata TaxID=349315 RepID=A0ABN2JR29_9ACTN
MNDEVPRPRSPGYYFYLSYAHTPPATAHSRGGIDHWVRIFQAHLSAEVARLARPDAGMRVTYFEPPLPLGAERRTALAAVLSVTEVLVPLLSPQYFNMSWPSTELNYFQQRVTATRRQHVPSHVQPVLWVPLPDSDVGPEMHNALQLGADFPAYAENGLRTMCQLSHHRSQYDQILQRLARRIVDAAERCALGRQQRVDRQMKSQSAVLVDTPFVIAVLAPTGNRLPQGRLRNPYGASSVLWRPFGDDPAIPVAEYAANLIERSGLPTMIVDYASAGERLEQCPGVLLIDPWILAGGSGREELQSALSRLREWVVPLIVLDESDPQCAGRGSSLAEDAAELLTNARPNRVRRVRRSGEFRDLIPILATQMRRQYLRHGPTYPPKGAQLSRPRLTYNDDSPTHSPER